MKNLFTYMLALLFTLSGANGKVLALELLEDSRFTKLAEQTSEEDKTDINFIVSWLEILQSTGALNCDRIEYTESFWKEVEGKSIAKILSLGESLKRKNAERQFSNFHAELKKLKFDPDDAESAFRISGKSLLDVWASCDEMAYHASSQEEYRKLLRAVVDVRHLSVFEDLFAPDGAKVIYEPPANSLIEILNGKTKDDFIKIGKVAETHRKRAWCLRDRKFQLVAMFFKMRNHSK